MNLALAKTSPTPARRLTYQNEPIRVIREEGMALLKQHWNEVAQFPELQVLDPDWDMYDAYEKNGRLWVLTVRDDGMLVGYIIMTLAMHLHYRTLKIAQEDAHFLHPDYRKGLAGYRLITITKKAMARIGARFVVMRTKAEHDHGLLFERAGGKKSDIVYTFPL